jgi:isoquinoline 1-oxidoreductase beta subunit
MSNKEFLRAEHRSTLRASHPRRRLRAPSRDAGAVLPQQPASTSFAFRAVDSAPWTSSLEAWPAAGGGVLVGITNRALAGQAMLRSSIKTAFLRVDAGGLSTLIIPYVALVPEAAACGAALVAAELGVAEERVAVEHRNSPDPDCATPRRLWIVDLGPESESSLALLAAAAHALLIAAAAERWRIGAGACRTAGGVILDQPGSRSLTFAQISQDAALQELPAIVRLRSGVRFPLCR